jgi:preprotein translocase SecE subunit
MKITSYINESLEELRHVRWPTRQQAVRLSAVVIVFTAIAAAAFGLLDFALAQILEVLLAAAV